MDSPGWGRSPTLRCSTSPIPEASSTSRYRPPTPIRSSPLARRAAAAAAFYFAASADIGAGGRGAEIGGDFILTAGEVLQIAVGGMGGCQMALVAAAAEVVLWSVPATLPLVIAGGGGGGGAATLPRGRRPAKAVSPARTVATGQAQVLPGGAGGTGGNGGGAGSGAHRWRWRWRLS